MVAFSGISPFRRTLIALNVPPMKGRCLQRGRWGLERRIREVRCMLPEFVFCPAAASGCRFSLPAAGGSGHCLPLSRFQRQLPFQESLLHAQPEDLILEDELFAKGH